LIISQRIPPRKPYEDIAVTPLRGRRQPKEESFRRDTKI